MIFRLSQKLNAKIKVGTLPTLPPDDNPFADWSAHLFLVDRAQYILASNTKSLYSTVMYGKGIADHGRFIERALSNLRGFLEADGQDFVYRRYIAPESGVVRFARALDRRVTGSMNNLIQQATFLLSEPDLSPFDVGFKLNETPMSVLPSSWGDNYGTPREVFKRLAEAGTLAPDE
jgi:hypothetical protein